MQNNILQYMHYFLRTNRSCKIHSQIEAPLEAKFMFYIMQFYQAFTLLGLRLYELLCVLRLPDQTNTASAYLRFGIH